MSVAQVDVEAQLALARAALDPNAAIAAAPAADNARVELEAPAGVAAPARVPGITLDIEIVPPPPFSRWRWFLCWALLKLAARVYPFKLDLYRTPRAWE